jgi:tetratricopeptide (TPR) repeat protein
MDPSLVKLDTTYQVQLAYAEAASAIDFILHRLGAPGLVRILKDLQQSQEEGAATAIRRVMGLDFDQFQAHWREFLAARKLQEHRDVRLPSFELKEQGKLASEDVNKEIQSAAARMHAHLGDRLRQRGRTQAAAEEYSRALDKDPASPLLLNKLATALIAQGQWQQALDLLQRSLELDADSASTYTNLGRVHIARQAYDQARLALWEAVQINPFDPAIHGHLAESYRQLGQADKAQQEQQLFERLRETQ